MGVAVSHTARALIMAAIGSLAVRVGVTDEYTNFVNEWMRWPLVVSGVSLVALALWVTLSRAGAVHADQHDEHGHDRASALAPWLLVLPVVVGFVIQPPALGAFVADRNANATTGSDYVTPALEPLDLDTVNAMPVSNFVVRATYDEGESLAGATVRLTGFVTTGDDGTWHVNRLTIACCAADAAAFRVEVAGAEAPLAEQWVEVVGSWVSGTGTRAGETPVLAADDVTSIDVPRRPYE